MVDLDKVGKAKTVFQAKPVGFVSFEQPGEMLERHELKYKREAVQHADELLGPYVRGEATLDSEAEARKLVEQVMDLTNFFNGRDRRIVAGTIMEEEGAWLAFANLVLGCLRQTRGGTW